MLWQVRDSIAALVRQANTYAATTDLWTSASCDPYITFTIHFIDDSWVLKSLCLDTVPLSTDHTGQNIADAMKDVLENWDLHTADLIASTTDNGSNVVAAFKILDLLRIGCFGHNLDLGIRKGLANNQMQRTLTRYQSLVELFHRSWKKNQRS